MTITRYLLDTNTCIYTINRGVSPLHQADPSRD
jgi:hypothetical protein